MNKEIQQRLIKVFPFLGQLPGDALKEMLSHGTYLSIEKGNFICMEGDRCSQIPLVLSGIGRVYKLSSSGREITLYRIESGQSCALTASCLLSHHNFPAFATAETDMEAVVFQDADLADFVRQHEPWRQFIFGQFADRFAHVMETIQEVAFQRVDTRLAGYLLHMKQGPDHEVRRTHEAISTDLGTSREVVSRILKEFEHQDLVELSRSRIVVTDPDALAKRYSETQ